MKSMNPHVGAGVAAAFVLTAGLALSGCFGQSSASSEQSVTSTSGASVVETSGDDANSSKANDASDTVSSDVSSATADVASTRVGASGAVSENPSNEDRNVLRADAEARGLQVFEGTLRIVSGTELCELEGIDPEMVMGKEAAEESTFAVLILDEPTKVAGGYGDGSAGEQEATHIGVGQNVPAYAGVEDTASQLLSYDGARVCVAGNPWFPTDVSLPLAPRMYSGELLYYDK